jgi:DnaJ-class molecular chaperone
MIEDKLHTFRIIRTCPECHGDGDEGSEGYPCGFCAGLGYIDLRQEHENLKQAEEENPFDTVLEI